MMEVTITYRAGPDQDGEYLEKRTTVSVDELMGMEYGPALAISLVASMEARKFWQGLVFSGALEEEKTFPIDRSDIYRPHKDPDGPREEQ